MKEQQLKFNNDKAAAQKDQQLKSDELMKREDTLKMQAEDLKRQKESMMTKAKPPE